MKPLYIQAYEANFSVIPLLAGEKKPAIKWKDFQANRMVPDKLVQKILKNKGNFGIILGKLLNGVFVFVLDIEDEAAVIELFKRLRAKKLFNLIALLESTYCIRTPNGGRHYYLRCSAIISGLVLAYDEPEEGRKSNKWPPLIETRGEGNYVVGEGSEVNGKTYTRIHGDIHNISEINEGFVVLLFDCCSELCKKKDSTTKPRALGATKKPHPREYDRDRLDVDKYPYLKYVLSKFEYYTQGANGLEAPCIVPYHGGDGVDSRPSLRITIGDNGRVVFYCRAGCNHKDVAYYAGLQWGDLYPPPGEKPAPNLMGMASPTMTVEQSLFASWVYTELIARLSLSGTGRYNLQRRGLNMAQIEGLGYKTYNPNLPKDFAIVEKLHEELGDRILEVPGFVRGKSLPVQLALPAEAILVPIRNSQDMIMALKGRLLQNSGAKFKLLAEAGAGALIQKIHFPHGYSKELCKLRVTEGEMKADIATALSNLYTIGCPGVQSLAQPIEFLSHFNPSAHIVLAPDYADLVKIGVADRVLSAIYFYQDAGFRVFLETWNSDKLILPKGIDDALREGADITEIPAEDAVELIKELQTTYLNDDFSNHMEN